LNIFLLLFFSFRVVQEIFEDTAPKEMPNNSGSTTQSAGDNDKKVPYTIIGSISEPGLGLKSWWIETST
jgi:DNA-directed RNA polymerase III subunit RPC8